MGHGPVFMDRVAWWPREEDSLAKLNLMTEMCFLLLWNTVKSCFYTLIFFQIISTTIIFMLSIAVIPSLLQKTFTASAFCFSPSMNIYFHSSPFLSATGSSSGSYPRLLHHHATTSGSASTDPMLRSLLLHLRCCSRARWGLRAAALHHGASRASWIFGPQHFSWVIRCHEPPNAELKEFFNATPWPRFYGLVNLSLGTSILWFNSHVHLGLFYCLLWKLSPSFSEIHILHIRLSQTSASSQNNSCSCWCSPFHHGLCKYFKGDH